MATKIKEVPFTIRLDPGWVGLLKKIGRKYKPKHLTPQQVARESVIAMACELADRFGVRR